MNNMVTFGEATTGDGARLEDPGPTPGRAIDSMEAMSGGAHPGYRRHPRLKCALIGGSRGLDTSGHVAFSWSLLFYGLDLAKNSNDWWLIQQNF